MPGGTQEKENTYQSIEKWVTIGTCLNSFHIPQFHKSRVKDYKTYQQGSM